MTDSKIPASERGPVIVDACPCCAAETAREPWTVHLVEAARTNLAAAAVTVGEIDRNAAELTVAEVTRDALAAAAGSLRLAARLVDAETCRRLDLDGLAEATESAHDETAEKADILELRQAGDQASDEVNDG